ncbi:MAG: alpha-galactosidase [Thermoactinospora sp.]|nr:alpha-galactosidase [Thermoactinospora sp.]
MSVFHDAERRLWLLRTPHSSYALRLDDGDCPRAVHWGAPLTLEQAAEIVVPAPRDISSFHGGPSDPELPAQTGASFGPASLQVRFADGAGGVEWRFDGHEIDGGHLRLRLADRHYPLAITLHYRVREGSDVIERWSELSHTGEGEPVEVQRCDSASWSPPRGTRLSHVVGAWSAENQLVREELPVGETVLTSRRGATSHQANPWLMLDDGTATEEHGEVWSAALAWSGSWRITVQRTPFDGVVFTGGAGHEGLRTHLGPGETWTSPVFSGLYGTAGFGGVSHAWHAHVLEHVLPHPQELRPIVYNSWEATWFDVNVDGQLALAKLAASAGAELFVLDDGWFGARVNDWAGLGDWTVNRDRFPQGLGQLIEGVHAYGMRFGLWVEPEMVNPDSDLYRAHPDWVIHMPNRTRTTMRNQLVLNFGRPDVAAWAHEWLDRLVSEHEIDFLKWDFNRSFTEGGWPDSGDPDRLWDAHVRNLYALLDRLRADHPHLRIEGCSGGGGRVDLGMLARVDEVWTSDNTDAVDRVSIQHGFTQVYPVRAMAAWVTDSPNPLTRRLVPLRFRFHVAMAGVLALGGNLTRWSQEELAEAAELVAQYKLIRPVVQHGVVHRLTPPDAPVVGVQYSLGEQVVVFAYRVNTRFGHAPWPLRLRGLDPEARYRDDDTGAEHSGAVLLAHGLPLERLPRGDYASLVVRLTRM